MIGALLVPITSRLLVCLQFYHIRDEGTGVEGLWIIHPLTALALEVCGEIPGCLAKLVKSEC